MEGIVLTTGENSPEVQDDAATVISKPAMLIEVQGDSSSVFYYFRSVGWNNTTLIEVGYQNNQWETISSTKNPSNEMLSDLLRKGKQLL